MGRAGHCDALLLRGRRRGRFSGTVTVSVNDAGGANSRNREVTGTQGVRSDELTRAKGDLKDIPRREGAVRRGPRPSTR
nr:MAG TPA: hypothetical protein [Caudoviricetes sp.]